jgi:DNA-binding transcriptional ArsR family regulator
MEFPQSVAASVAAVGGLKGFNEAIPKQKRLTASSDIFQSVGDPIRLSILYALSIAPLCVCVLKPIVKIADSKLSYHLASLKSASLIAQRYEGRFIIYSITDLGRRIVSLCNDIG